MSEEDQLTEEILQQLSLAVSAITSEGGIVHQLTAKVLYSAIKMLASKKLKENKKFKLLGYSLEEYQLRLGAEAEYRKSAHYAATLDEKIKWVDRANSVRPVTLF